MNILVIQNYNLTPPGLLGECVEEEKGYLDIFLPADGEQLPSSSLGYDGLMILGGPMHAEDDATYPQLRSIINLIHQFYANKKPIFAVCLGAQVLARAFRKRVYKHSRFEVGFHPVFLMPSLETKDELLFRKCPEKLYVMQWHFDTFDLPEEATLLMFGKNCRNQAYRIGNNIYGFQFHLEVTKEILQSWIESKNEFIETNYPNFAEKISQQIEQYLDKSVAFCRQVSKSWINLVKASMSQ